VIVYIGQHFENNKRSANYWATFSTVQVTYVLILTQKGWATFWVILSQTQLVTLLLNKIFALHRKIIKNM
jgi:hypothetical protein